MSKPLAERMADYAQRLRFEDLPAEVVHEAKRVVVDSLGVAIGAWKEEPCVVARTVASTMSANPGATLWGTRHVAPADWAAFANGCCVRYFDYNDTYLSKEPAHPSDNIPACFAAAELTDSGGRDLITAIVLAYEVQCRFADAVSIRSRGWDHVTYGCFSVALGASKLMKLDAVKTKHALGIAGVTSAALRQSRVGELSHWKGVAFANAARHGIYSAMLARAGMTGPAPIFEGEKGFEKLVSQEPMKSAPPFAAGYDGPVVPPDGFMIRQSCIKFYPAEYHAQSAVGAALELRKQIGKPDNIESVLIESHDAAVDIIGSEPEKWRPTSRETADHSLPYMVAAALMDGELTDRQFEPARFSDPKLLDLVQRVKVQRHKELSAMYPGAVGNILHVKLRDGKTLTLRMDYPKGHARNRLTDQEIEQKYHTLADPVLGAERANAILKWVWNLEKQSDLHGLMPLLEMKN
ncbi:MAG: MmgE/PrpD family protein [Tepidisphaeraceae bacterium]